MAGLVGLRLILRKIRPVMQKRLVSTSKKSNDTACSMDLKAGVKNVQQKSNSNWIYYGFDANSKQADRTAMHSLLFGSITLCMVMGGFFLAYLPDFQLRDWSQREAFLELRRRESQGLPLVNPNLIDPATMTLPSDEELGDAEIII